MKVRVLGFAFLLIMISVSLSSGENPDNPLYEKYRGILSEWHKARICMPCHINTLSGKELERFLSCTPCHNPDLNLNSPEQLSEIHDVDVCIKCHVGSQYNSKNLGLNVHVPHKDRDCSLCHGDEGTISKPDKNLCTDCHDSNPHNVHSRILDSICFDCHSDNMKDYLPEIKKTEILKATPAPTPVPEKKEITFKTISDFILWIVNLLF